MGFRGAIKSGGGFLNNVDGEITGYEFTTVPPNSKEESEWVYYVPSIKQDGADDEVTQHFFLGGADRYEISKDGQTITDADGGEVTVGAKTPFGRLLASMLDNGLDEAELPDLEGGDDLEMSGLNTRRFRFIQEIDEEATKKLGKRKDKKTKKEYPRTNTVVSKVYDVEAKSGKGKSAGKANGKAAGKSKKKDDDGDELQEEAVSVLTDLLADTKDGEIPRAKLSMALTKKLMKNENREPLRKLITSDDFLALEEGWTFDADSKAETIASA